MAILEKMTTLKLKKLRRELEDELRRIAPTVVAQIEVVDAVLKSREVEGGTYASCRIAAEAVDLFFKTHGDFKHTKKEILKTILDGGYVAKNPKGSRQQLSDRVNYLLENNILVRRDELLGHNHESPASS